MKARTAKVEGPQREGLVLVRERGESIPQGAQKCTSRVPGEFYWLSGVFFWGPTRKSMRREAAVSNRRGPKPQRWKDSSRHKESR